MSDTRGAAPFDGAPKPDYVVTKTTADGEQIRKFADANISAAIDRALAQLPADKTVAVVATANLEGATGAVMVRLGSDWSFVTTVTRKWSGEFTGETAVKWSR